MDNLIIRQTQHIDNTNINIDQLLKEFYESIDVDEITIKTYRKGINNFIKWLRNNDIRTIDKKVMLLYKQYLIDTYKDTTATTYLSGVRNLFNFLEELGIPNVMRNIKGIKITREFRKQPLTKEQVLKIKSDRINNLISLQDYRDFVMFNLLLHNGLRTIELNRADIDDIKNIGGQYILKIQGKGKKDKTQNAVLTDSVLIPLLAYLDMRGKDTHPALFISLSSNCYGRRLSTKSISKRIKTMLVNNGYISKDLTAHSLRHTSLTFALKGGATLQETKELARHSDINTTLIYSHNIDRIENAPERYIEEYLKTDKIDRKDKDNGKDNINM